MSSDATEDKPPWKRVPNTMPKHANLPSEQGSADQENEGKLKREEETNKVINSMDPTSDRQEDRCDPINHTNEPAEITKGNHEDQTVTGAVESGDHTEEIESQSQNTGTEMTPKEPTSSVLDANTKKGKSKKVNKPDRKQNEQITEEKNDVDLQKENEDLKKQNKSLHEEIQKLEERCKVQNDNLDREKKEKDEMKRNFKKEEKQIESQLSHEQYHCERLLKEKTDALTKLAELDKQNTNYHNEIVDLKERITKYQEENWFKRQYDKHKNPGKNVQRKAQNVNPEVRRKAQNVNPEVAMGAQNVNPGPKPDSHQKNKVCVASSNKSYMAAVAQNVEELLHPFFPSGDLDIFQKKITSTINDSDGFYEGATLVVLVATASQRMLLISNKEDSQVGKAYQQAEKEKASVFLVVAGHSDSDGLPDTVPYANSLTQVFSSQPKVRMLAEQRNLISVAYTYSPSELKFNTEQSKLIGEWLQRELEFTKM